MARVQHATLVDIRRHLQAHRKMTDPACGVARAMGVHCELVINQGYSCLNNAPALTQRTLEAAKAFLSFAQVVDIELRISPPK